MADEEDFLDDDLLDDFEDTETTPESELQTSETTTDDPVVKMFRDKGFQIPDGVSGEILLNNIREMARRQQSMPSEMDLTRLREESARFREAQSPKTEQTEAKRTLISKPEGAEDYVTFDQKSGMYVPKSNWVQPSLVDQMNAWHRQNEARKRLLIENPEEYLKNELKIEERLESVKKAARDEALQEFRRLQDAERKEAEQRAFWDQNAASLYQVDDKGFVVTDFAGQPAFTPKGLKFLEFEGSILQDFPNADPFVVQRKAYEMADKWEKNEKRRQARAQNQTADPEEVSEVETQPSPEELAETQKQSFTQKARAADERGKQKKGDRVINRDASVVASAKNGTAQNEGGDFVELFRSNLKAAGLKI